MSYVLLGLLYIALAVVSVTSTSNSIFANLTSPDVNAIKNRLEEERAHTLLLQSDLEIVMEKVARIERDNGIRVQAQSQGNVQLNTTGRLGGSLYTRWGSKSCDGQGTELVYEGFAGGSEHRHAGGAANMLCLPRDPIFNLTKAGVQAGQGRAYVYGVEYEFVSSNSIGTRYTALANHEMPCAVCRAPRSTVLMVPARNSCPERWTQEYSGYLIAGHYGHASATSYECMDENPEALIGTGNVNNQGKLIYFVEGRCGSLRCPPYAEGKELTCVVCTL